VIVVALVLTLGGGSSSQNNAGSKLELERGPPAQVAQRPPPSATPTVGELQLAQLQAGDCLTGANLQLNKNTAVAEAEPGGGRAPRRTAPRVFYASNTYWAKNGSYPGNETIKKDATAACNSAFASYVGIAYSKSLYTWTDIRAGRDHLAGRGPGTALRALLPPRPSSRPAVTLHESLKGAAK